MADDRIEPRRSGRSRVILHAHVGDDAVDPRGQTRFAAKIRQAAMNPKEHLLREILGPRSVLDRARDQRKHQVLVSIDQLLKRSLVPPAAAIDELPLVGWVHQPWY